MNLGTVVKFKALESGQTEMTVREYEFPVCPMLVMAEMGLEQCMGKRGRSFQKC
jgi:hypothetical protein